MGLRHSLAKAGVRGMYRKDRLIIWDGCPTSIRAWLECEEKERQTSALTHMLKSTNHLLRSQFP